MATTSLVVALFFLDGSSGAPQFQRIDAEASGLDFSNQFDEAGARSYLYQSGFACGAVVIGDVDGDQKPDLFLCGGAGENALFFNRGELKFERSPANELLAGGENWATGAALADLDNDGDLDIHLCNYATPNQLFLNDGSGGFTEATAASGLGVVGPSLEPLFADFDRDGDLDLFLLNNKLYLPEGRPQRPPYKMVDGKPVVDDDYAPYLRILPKGDGNFTIDGYGHPDRLLINDGVGGDGVPKFRDVTAASGIAGIGHGLSATLIDIDGDGWLDIFVANDFLVPDRLWKNLGPGKDGVPRFSDAVTHFLPQISWSSMGSAAGDLDDDGYTDLMVVDMAATTHFKAKISMGEMKGRMRKVLETGWPRQAMRNHVFFGTGTPRYQELAWFAGLASTDWSWAVKLADFDLDGRLDIFLTNGHTRNFSDADVPFSTAALIGKTQFDIYRDSGRLLEENLAFRNAGRRQFEAAPDWGLGHEGMSYAAATGDLDADGDPDLVVANLGEPIHLYRNDASGGNRFSVRLEGTRSNRFAIGARVVLTDSSGVRRTRWVTPQSGFLSQDDPSLLFGLGDAKPVSLEVDWPSGIRQIAKLAGAKSGVTLTEKGKITPRRKAPTAEFVASVPPAFTHRERPFDDFDRQPLLPGKLSQLGPCLAAGDVDGDGDADLFAGGAAGQSSVLFLNDGAGNYVESPQPALQGFGKHAEAADAEWFDADGDGDLDLYVVSGSVEYDPGHVFYRDRLYINNAGVLAEAPEGCLPDLRDSGSCVAIADYDADGDFDVFVGSRSLVGSYPLSPESRLLRNDGDLKFTEVTGIFGGSGLVTDAAWVDSDGDGDQDLCLSTEWGPLRMFSNADGKLTEVTVESGWAEDSGWWNCIEPADVDGDGDLDLLAGNVGWNTKYGKSAELYYGDMDGSGDARIVEAKHSGDSLLPVRGRSCSSHAMPSLAKRFGSYRQFAGKDLFGIYSEGRLAGAEKFTAEQFASGVWINEGAGKPFRWLAFPDAAQFSQVNAIAAGDFDGDGKLEIILGQNHDTREAETGLWRGGVGCHLEWGGRSFVTIPPAESGIVMPADTKAVITLDGSTIVAGQNNGSLLLFRKR